MKEFKATTSIDRGRCLATFLRLSATCRAFHRTRSRCCGLSSRNLECRTRPDNKRLEILKGYCDEYFTSDFARLPLSFIWGSFISPYCLSVEPIIAPKISEIVYSGESMIPESLIASSRCPPYHEERYLLFDDCHYRLKQRVADR